MGLEERLLSGDLGFSSNGAGLLLPLNVIVLLILTTELAGFLYEGCCSSALFCTTFGDSGGSSSAEISVKGDKASSLISIGFEESSLLLSDFEGDDSLEFALRVLTIFPSTTTILVPSARLITLPNVFFLPESLINYSSRSS